MGSYVYRKPLSASNTNTRIATAAADRKLLLGILKLQNISVDFAAMAKYMATDGQVCTAGAVQNRLKKLKAMARDG